MKNTKVILLPLVILFIFSSFALTKAESVSNAYTVSGCISTYNNAEASMGGCLVEIYAAGTSTLLGSTYTDASGNYSIGGIHPGSVDVLAFPNDITEEDCVETGYGTSVTVSSSNVSGINITLQAK